MMVQSGTVYSLQELGTEFLAFAQLSNATTQAWELVDNRLSTFYGATLKIPMKKWEDENHNCPYFYISLQHINVTANTYSTYFYAGITPTDELICGDGTYTYSAQNLSPRGYFNQISWEEWHNNPNYSTTILYKYGSTNYPNVFRNSGEFLAISPHTLYDENLWMCEQGGNSCEDVTVVNNGSQTVLNLMPYIANYYNRHDGGYNSQLPSPILFPGSGTPWLTMSNQNKTDFEVSIYGIKYWFVKTDYVGIITYQVFGGDKIPHYQSIAFGMMDGVSEESYMFPLFVAGGNVGISNDIMIFHYINARCPSYVAGNVYDLDLENIALSNSNLLHPTLFNDATVTNFKVLSPQGVWEYITAHKQSVRIVPYYFCNCGSPCSVYEWGSAIEPPTSEDTNLEWNTIFPNMGHESRYKIDTYTVNERLVPYKYSSPLQKVLVCLNDKLNYGENGIIGIIPNVYSSWYKELPDGEIIISGHRYLSVPNGWNDRLYHYPYHVGEIVNNEWQQNVIRPRYDDRNNVLMNYQFTDKLLIPLEEGGWN